MSKQRWTCTTLFGVVAAFITACSGQASAPVEPTDAAENVVVVVEKVEETAVSDATPTQEGVMVELEDLGPAPEIENEIWLNTNKPLPLSTQRGKVVLLEFWTFG